MELVAVKGFQALLYIFEARKNIIQAACKDKQMVNVTFLMTKLLLTRILLWYALPFLLEIKACS